MITVSAFRNTSSEKIVSFMHFQKVILPNDKILDFETLLPFIQKSDLLFCFGQKNGLKDKVCLEVVANEDGNSIQTDFDIDTFEKLLITYGIQSKKSSNPGKSFCNSVYYKSMKYIKSHKTDCKVIFIHIPYENKITDINEFALKLENVILAYSNQ